MHQNTATKPAGSGPAIFLIAATRIIKEINPSTPILALSAYAFEDSIQEARDAGCNEFISKPFKVEHLIDTIEKYI